MRIESWQLLQRQALPLDLKEIYTERRIRSWYERYDGNVYIAFSGGKDSTVLCHQVKKIYPKVPMVFINTGLEYPEIVQFVHTFKNIIELRPKKKFPQILNDYGLPLISKQVSMGIDRWNNTKSIEQKKLRLYGGVNPSSGKKQYPSIPKKWHFLLDAPFKCSDRCCYFMKKEPFQRYEKETGAKPFIGTMAHESNLRKMNYLKYGCNGFSQKKPKSTPLGFWKEEDIWSYIQKYNISYSKIYDMGESRTGCMYCMFGAHLEKEPNRFQRMKITHPKRYYYCINKLGLGVALDYIGVKY